MRLLLSRHGNTFGPKDSVVWTGATNDLPLVEAGFSQADRFAQALMKNQVHPAAIFCSPLQRTIQYANVIVEKLGLSFQPQIDSRLQEVDYGEWTGLTQDEVKSRFGEEDLKNWEELSQWPRRGNWGSSPERVTSEIHSFVCDLVENYTVNDTLIVISSNGKLRYFLKFVPGEFERRIQNGSFKVKTGHICKLVYENDQAQVCYWNQDPLALAHL